VPEYNGNEISSLSFQFIFRSDAGKHLVEKTHSSKYGRRGLMYVGKEVIKEN
jgi:hypothetical protein